ncbi:ComF family protein [Sulfidibacter corallicola]|uniref:ComF family protein n=1 Tax=Sulfidibacter corallicola TaxID=2818388 RepID=A0A8A4TEB3_SULCO|nr:hypothetical protein [Sulfidibacter corallicola]QTD47572.1 ComF family protein [Sulfidibacter corallicola]
MIPPLGRWFAKTRESGPAGSKWPGRLRQLDPLQWVAPADCLLCGRSVRGPVCADCSGLFQSASGKGCRRCANLLVSDHALSCPWCCRLRDLPDHLACGFYYRHEAATLYRLIKFEGYWPLMKHLLEPGMHAFFRIPFLEYDGLVPVPEPFVKKMSRFFNPSLLLADLLCARTGLDVLPVVGIRPFSRGQVGLSYAERRANARRRFFLRRAPPERLILVDDVLTTGATLEAMTAVLRAAKVRRIAWFTLLRTP